jgi:hypothetical protein
MSQGGPCAWKSLRLTIAALVLSTGLARAQCPTGLGGGITYGVDIRGVLTLTACDRTWMRGVDSGRRVRIKAGAMTFVAEPGHQLQLHRGGISVQPSSIRWDEDSLLGIYTMRVCAQCGCIHRVTR